MRSKFAISTLVVASLFGSTLIASAQTQTAPGASSQGTVSPGATSGKKTQHEKGMTTGSSTRSGAKKRHDDTLGSRQRGFRRRLHGCSEKRQQVTDILFAQRMYLARAKGPGAIWGLTLWMPREMVCERCRTT